MASCQPASTTVCGARVHNLKNIDVDVLIGRLVTITGVSDSGKSSLALAVLYAERSRCYIEALSTCRRPGSEYEEPAKAGYELIVFK